MLNATGRDYTLNPLNPYVELPRQRVVAGRFRPRFSGSLQTCAASSDLVSLLSSQKFPVAVCAPKREITLEPGFARARAQLGWIYLATGKMSEAVAQLEALRRFDGNAPSNWGPLGFGYVRGGRTNDAQTVLGRLLEFQQRGYDQRLDIALLQHGLGDDEQALASLEKAWQERAVDLERLNWDPLWKNLRRHPRVQAILKKMNLSERLHEDYH